MKTFGSILLIIATTIYLIACFSKGIEANNLFLQALFVLISSEIISKGIGIEQ